MALSQASRLSGRSLIYITLTYMLCINTKVITQPPPPHLCWPVCLVVLLGISVITNVKYNISKHLSFPLRLDSAISSKLVLQVYIFTLLQG